MSRPLFLSLAGTQRASDCDQPVSRGGDDLRVAADLVEKRLD
jgi:hypothetical protein